MVGCFLFVFGIIVEFKGMSKLKAVKNGLLPDLKARLCNELYFHHNCDSFLFNSGYSRYGVDGNSIAFPQETLDTNLQFPCHRYLFSKFYGSVSTSILDIKQVDIKLSCADYILEIADVDENPSYLLKITTFLSEDWLEFK